MAGKAPRTERDMRPRDDANGKAPADVRTTAADAEAGDGQPLFSFTYELTSQLVDDAATALAGDSRNNAPMLASYGVLAAILLVAISPIGRNATATPLLVALVVVEVALWALARRWHDVAVRRLRRRGLDPALVPERQRRHEVRVFDDRVTVRPRGGAEVTWPTASMRKPYRSTSLCLLRFDGGYVPVPRGALSATRHAELVRWACERTGERVDA